MSEPARQIVDADVGQVVLPAPILARSRATDAKSRLDEAHAAAKSASLAVTQTIQAAWAARLTIGFDDIQRIESYADSAICCLEMVKAAAGRARGSVEGVAP